MKKTGEDNQKPQFFELEVNPRDVREIEEKYKFNSEHVNFYKQKLRVFEKLRTLSQQEKDAKQVA